MALSKQDAVSGARPYAWIAQVNPKKGRVQKAVSANTPGLGARDGELGGFASIAKISKSVSILSDGDDDGKREPKRSVQCRVDLA